MCTAVGKQPARLAGYQVLGVIARDARRVVFSALQIDPLLNKRWKVTLKVVWDAGIARAEAGHLVELHPHQAFGGLVDFFEVGPEEVSPFLHGFVFPEILDRCPMAVGRVPGWPGGAGKAGVLVLPCLQGLPIIDRIERCPGQPRFQLNDHLMVKDVLSRQWLQQRLRWPFLFPEKVRILGQVAAALRACHEKGIVHGGLRPESLMYDRGRRQITLLDVGGSRAAGGPGWQAPEHMARVKGDRAELTAATDVFLFGLLLKRLLISEPGTIALDRLSDRCCRADSSHRPSMVEVGEAVAAFESRRRRRIHLVRLGLTALLTSTAWCLALLLGR